MKPTLDSLAWVVWAVLAGAIVASGCASDDGGDGGDASKPAAGRLVIYSPHSEAIQKEFTRAFQRTTRRRPAATSR